MDHCHSHNNDNIQLKHKIQQNALSSYKKSINGSKQLELLKFFNIAKGAPTHCVAIFHHP